MLLQEDDISVFENVYHYKFLLVYTYSFRKPDDKFACPEGSL